VLFLVYSVVLSRYDRIRVISARLYNFIWRCSIMVDPGNPTTDLDIAVVVCFYGDVVLVGAWELAVDLVALLVLFDVEAWDELTARIFGGVTISRVE
jgi:hypothetical protein